MLFCVDASGSMAARKRMEQVKTAILSLLLDAYQRRDKVGLVTFRGAGAELALPPTRSVDIAAAPARASCPPAGVRRSPRACSCAAEILRLERIRDPRRRPLLVVVTDGRATAGPDACARSRQAAALLAADRGRRGRRRLRDRPVRLGLAARLAEHLRRRARAARRGRRRPR